MNADMSLVSLILEASLLVQIVMAILVLASVMSWIIIFSKRGLCGILGPYVMDHYFYEATIDSKDQGGVR